jgi:hypothetical protein
VPVGPWALLLVEDVDAQAPGQISGGAAESVGRIDEVGGDPACHIMAF